MSGLIGVMAQETARFSMFGASMTALEKPEGAKTQWWFGHDIAANANELVRQMYAQDKDWLWLLGDDHSFSPGLLTKLLEHDVPIVVPLCLQRNAPYGPVIWVTRSHPGNGKEPVVVRAHLQRDFPNDFGLVEVYAAGSGGMLVRREVFDAVDEPWFEAGVQSSVQLGEDTYFCEKARSAGYSVFCDLSASLGHCSTSVVWPVHEADGWTFGFSMMGGFKITMPPAGSWEYAAQVGATK